MKVIADQIFITLGLPLDAKLSNITLVGNIATIETIEEYLIRVDIGSRHLGLSPTICSPSGAYLISDLILGFINGTITKQEYIFEKNTEDSGLILFNTPLNIPNTIVSRDDIGNLSVEVITLEASSGTPPIITGSSTLIPNLNADLLDGQHGSYYLQYNTTDALKTVYDQDIYGLRNNSNTTFTIPDNFIINSSRVYLNGLRLQNNNLGDYYESGTNEITFNYPILSTDLLLMDYIRN